MKNRGCVADAFLERFWRAPGCQKSSARCETEVPFGDHFQPKIEKSKKWHPESHPKIDAEKVLKNDAKRLQNEAKMDAKIYDFSYFFEKGENARNYLFYNRKRGSGHRKTHQKSIRFRSKIDARNRHAKSMENDAKRAPKWEPKSIKNPKMSV